MRTTFNPLGVTGENMKIVYNSPWLTLEPLQISYLSVNVKDSDLTKYKIFIFLKLIKTVSLQTLSGDWLTLPGGNDTIINADYFTGYEKNFSNPTTSNIMTLLQPGTLHIITGSFVALIRETTGVINWSDVQVKVKIAEIG